VLKNSGQAQIVYNSKIINDNLGMNMEVEVPQIEISNRTSEVNKLYLIIERLFAKCQEQENTIELLKEEINRLKGHKGKPKIGSSKMDGDKKGNNKGRHNPGRMNRKALKKEEVIIKAPNVPEGSRFKGYQDYTIQELVIEAKTVNYRLERWQSPDDQYIIAKLPEEIKGYPFGPILRSYIEHQNLLGVTEPQILEQLRAIGIKISAGEISHLLIDNKESFHQEKNEILQAGISSSKYINVDDTGARHDGKNGFCTHIGNELFAWFSSTESKSRINFLELLRGKHKDYVVDKNAIEYMQREKMPKAILDEIKKNKRAFNNKEIYIRNLNRAGIKKEGRLLKVAIEGALIGGVLLHGFSVDLKIISDDAGQFNIFQHALCWIHAERLINRLVPLSENQAKIIETVLNKFWVIYADLKAYKLNPSQEEKKRITKCFDELCATESSYPLSGALQRLARNKKELLLVLKYPEIPLHNNLSENDIREYVKKRKISGGTRSALGRQYRDTFISLKKTCRKLGVNFWEYLLDRNNKTGRVPHLPTLIGHVSLLNSS
jgi:hypothetical protein